MSEIFTLLDMRHCQISSSMCLRLFFFSSHTPWADCYLCNLFLLILWEPYIKERPAWEERTGILSVLWSLMQFSAWGDLNLSIQKSDISHALSAMWGYSRFTAFFLCDHSIWSSFVRMMFAAVIWGRFWLTTVLRIWCTCIPTQKAEELCSSIALCRPCSQDLLVKSLEPQATFCVFSWVFLIRNVLLTDNFRTSTEVSCNFVGWSLEHWPEKVFMRLTPTDVCLNVGHVPTLPLTPPSSGVTALRVQNCRALEGESCFWWHLEEPKVSADHC